MTKLFSTFIFLCLLSISLSAQSVGIGTASPDASAALDVTATDKGLLIPRVSLASAIPSPAAGLMVHQTTAPAGFYYYNGTAWTMIGAQGPQGPAGPQGPSGATGPAGAAGPGVPTGGTANQVLTKVDGTNYNTQWSTPSSGGGIQLVTEAAKNAMTSAPNGTLVYQTDHYKGIYAKESDGWRMQSGDLPIFYINLGNLNFMPYTGPTYTLNASHHRIFVELQNQDVEHIPLITLPAANTCKGRTYYFYVYNNIGEFSSAPAPYWEYGFGISFVGADQYIQLDVPLFQTMAQRKSSLIPIQRQFAIQSDGTDWREILNDKGHPDWFNSSGTGE